MKMAGPIPQPGILGISPYVGGESKVPGIAKPARVRRQSAAHRVPALSSGFRCRFGIGD